MTVEQFENDIRTRFMTQIEEPEYVTVQYDNQDYSPPDATEWIRVTIVGGQTDQIEMGDAGKERTVGVLIAQVFTPLDSGTQGAVRLVDAIRVAFRRVTAGTVRFRTPTHVRIGRRPNERWWQENVRCPFYVDATV